MKDELLYCPLGGAGEIGMNMNLFGYGQEDDHKSIGAEYIFQVGYLDYKRLSKEVDADTVMMSVQRNMRAALNREQSLLEKNLYESQIDFHYLSSPKILEEKISFLSSHFWTG